MKFFKKVQKHITDKSLWKRGTMPYKILIAVLFVGVSAFASNYSHMVSTHVNYAYAANPGYNEIKGFLWMDDIGWISLSSDNDQDPLVPGVQTSASLSLPEYGVWENPTTKEWRGYAWSATVGWVHFSDTSCPTGTGMTIDATHPCGAQLISNGSNEELRGFAEFVTPTSNITPWWDPYISFSSANDHDTLTTNIQPASFVYGAVMPVTGYATSVSGSGPAYAWHSDGGWIEFNNVERVPGQPATIHLIPNSKEFSSFDALTPATFQMGPPASSPSDPLYPYMNFTSVKLWYYKDQGAPNYTSCTSEALDMSNNPIPSLNQNWDPLPVWLTPSVIPTGITAANTNQSVYQTAFNYNDYPAGYQYKLHCSYVDGGQTITDTATAIVIPYTQPATCSYSYGNWNTSMSCHINGSVPSFVLQVDSGSSNLPVTCSASPSGLFFPVGYSDLVNDPQNASINGGYDVYVDGLGNQSNPQPTVITVTCVDSNNQQCATTSPSLEANMSCNTNNNPPICTPPQILVNNVCVTPNNPPAIVACNDGIDNDGDGKIDFSSATWSATVPVGTTEDLTGCMSATDIDESEIPNPCSDGIDNDGDGKMDFDASTWPSWFTGPKDPTCKTAQGKTEKGGIFWER